MSVKCFQFLSAVFNWPKIQGQVLFAFSYCYSSLVLYKHEMQLGMFLLWFWLSTSAAGPPIYLPTIHVCFYYYKSKTHNTNAVSWKSHSSVYFSREHNILDGLCWWSIFLNEWSTTFIIGKWVARRWLGWIEGEQRVLCVVNVTQQEHWLLKWHFLH